LPEAGVIGDEQGNLYGTTIAGGGRGCGNKGCGTVFRVAPDGRAKVLYVFQGGEDGWNPMASLVLDRFGNLYGTTMFGGGNSCRSNGCGTVFEIAPDGAETVLHRFADTPDGSIPLGGLLIDRHGNLVGTTEQGGENHKGTVFQIGRTAVETILYSFCSVTKCPDGANPTSTLIADKAGTLYGTTQFGGTQGWGTVFELTKRGAETVLYSFCQFELCTDGQTPVAGVTMDRDGNLFGTTYEGGATGYGEVYKLTPNGAESIVHSFLTELGDGLYPQAPVLFDKAGNLYGMSLELDVPDCDKKNGTVWRGVVYRLAPDGTEKLYCVPAYYYGALNQRHGYLYGAASGNGGRYSPGIVFSIKE
jgi:uncharacterized repeat protein (TIGR03803 family)